MTSQPISPAVGRHVKVTLEDLNGREEVSIRTVYLFPPLFELKIGRASQTDKHLQPAASNAWFNLKVISREHAVLRADPLMEEMYIKDTNSMHGTYLYGRRLESNRDTLLTPGHTFQLGAESLRGDQTYKPLELSVKVEWEPRSAIPSRRPHAIPRDLASVAKNSFSIDYSEEEDDDDIEYIGESVRANESEMSLQSIHSRTFSVPDSDDSESSDVEGYEDEESAPSSPTEDLDMDPKSVVPISAVDEVTGPSTSRSEMKSTLVEPDLGQHPNTGSQLDADSAETQNGVAEDDPETTSSIDEDDHHSEYSELDYLESEAGPDEEEEQAFDDVHQHDSRTGEAQTIGRSYARLPSPSDAALPKPSWYQPAKLAGVPHEVDQVHSQTVVFPNTFQSPPAASLPHFQPFGYPYNMPWSGSDASNGFQGLYDQNFGCSTIHGPHHSLQQSSGAYLFDTSQEIPPTLKPLTCTGTVSTDIPLAKPSKVSINDIIDDVVPDATCGSSKLKRKADEISTTSATEQLGTSVDAPPRAATSIEEHAGDDHLPAEVVETLSDVEMIEESQYDPDTTLQKFTPSHKKSVTFLSEPVIIAPEVERPRKKQKVEDISQGSNFFKYVATAVAGATVGVFGTVFGLAALPTDYFI